MMQALLTIWRDANARESERHVATFKFANSVLHFRARERERVEKLAQEYINANDIEVTIPNE